MNSEYLTSDFWYLVAGYGLRVTGCGLLVMRYALLVTGLSSLVIYHSFRTLGSKIEPQNEDWRDLCGSGFCSAELVAGQPRLNDYGVSATCFLGWKATPTKS